MLLRPFFLLCTALLACTGAALVGAVQAADRQPAAMAAAYAQMVDRRLQVPAEVLLEYAALAEAALQQAGASMAAAQWLFLVDRNAHVQAGLLLWRSADGDYLLAGASPVSTGRPGAFDHFQTPRGVYPHTPSNPDFRAEGTRNQNGIRGYGAKGMRVFDFGWQQVPKGWGDGATIQMRLQVHATDPQMLERRLGSVQSKGCIRIPATLNRFLDHFGVLDAEYERELQAGRSFWVLDPQREPVEDAGVYLVVVDSGRDAKPPWSVAGAPVHEVQASTSRRANARGLAARVLPQRARNVRPSCADATCLIGQADGA